MNAVEIEVAVSELAVQEFNAVEFPFAFLEAFGNKATTLKRLRRRAGARCHRCEPPLFAPVDRWFRGSSG